MCIMKTEYSQWYIFLLCTFLKFEFDSLSIIKQGEWLGHFSIHLIEEKKKVIWYEGYGWYLNVAYQA